MELTGLYTAMWVTWMLYSSSTVSGFVCSMSRFFFKLYTLQNKFFEQNQRVKIPDVSSPTASMWVQPWLKKANILQFEDCLVKLVILFLLCGIRSFGFRIKYYVFILYVLCNRGQLMAQGNPCGMYGGLSDTRTDFPFGFPLSLSFQECSIKV